MPSPLALPTISDHLTAAGNALTGERDRYGDQHRGSLYEHAGAGPTAVLFAQEADRDRDAFQDIYFDDATGKALTRLVTKRYGIPRILDTYGVGTCSFARSSNAAGGGPFLEGTRIQVTGTPPAEYVVAADTTVAGNAVTATVPIRASIRGTGTAGQFANGLQLEDSVYDPLWLPTSLTCADGTDFEDANTYRARAREQRVDDRNGYENELTLVCQAAGAAYVKMYPSQYGLDLDDFDDDYGDNVLYVADQNFQSTPALINACTVALEGCRVLGAQLWVGGIVQSSLAIVATVYLIDDPGKLETVPILRAATQALLAYFAPTTSGFLFKLDALGGVCVRSHPAIQSVAFTLPASEPSLTPAAWPVNLTRWTLNARDIQLTLAGPI